MDALTYLENGQFPQAIVAYEAELKMHPESLGAADGLAASLMGAGQFSAALPVLQKVHRVEMREVPDGLGQALNIACALWCSGDYTGGMLSSSKLLEDFVSKKIRFSPDLAGGATYGAILFFMAALQGNESYILQAETFLEGLQKGKSRSKLKFPIECVDLFFRATTFDKACEAALGTFSYATARNQATKDLQLCQRLGELLFYDGIAYLREGNAEMFKEKMAEVAELGHQTRYFFWYLARSVPQYHTAT